VLSVVAQQIITLQVGLAPLEGGGCMGDVARGGVLYGGRG
jgi:hypothetical protein